MAARPHVPEFGNWDCQENVPYTVYFEKARKGRGGSTGKMINPNDPQENPEMFPNMSPSHPPASPPPQSRTRDGGVQGQGRGSVKSRMNKEDGQLRQFADSPARNENLSRRTSGETTPHPARNENLSRRTSGETTPQHPVNRGRQARQSAGSDFSIERSPLNPHQAKFAGRGGASPAWGDGKNSNESSQGGHGRSRGKQPRGDESPDGSAAVPRFGDWDESNPQSADNYTHIFNQVRDQRHNVDSNPSTGNRVQSSYPRPRQTDSGRQARCFPCLGL